MSGPADAQVGSWLKDLEPSSSPDHVSDESDPQESYTNLITNEEKCWRCPECHQPRDDTRPWALKLRGYKNMPIGYTRPVPNCYPKHSERENLLFFGNPSMVTICQNGWGDGLDGSRCTFDRTQADGFRKKDLETKDGVGTSKYRALGFCPRFSHTKADLKKCPALEAYVESEASHATCADVLNCYSEQNPDLWEGSERFSRPFTCDGEEGIIRCKSRKFGAGLEKDSEGTPCSGYYGCPIVFGDNEEQADGSFKRVERTWEPGEVDPAP